MVGPFEPFDHPAESRMTLLSAGDVTRLPPAQALSNDEINLQLVGAQVEDLQAEHICAILKTDPNKGGGSLLLRMVW